MSSLYLYVIVFVSGAAVLALEILGTRILGPFYGVSLFLWSALISVTLLALSLGYALGGRWADREATPTKLYYLVASAGLWTLLIPWIRRPVLLIAEPFGLRFAVLVAAFALFFAPLTLLGMVSPYAIKLRARSIDEVGRAAGDLYAVSTVGGVVAALLTGFFLIPNFGVSRLTYGVGASLIVVAAAGMFSERRKEGADSGDVATAVVLVLVSAAFAWLLPRDQADPEIGLRAVRQSPYAELRVLDTAAGRHLLIDGGIHTIVDPASWQSSFSYVGVVGLARRFFDEPGSMLLVGLGGGSVLKSFAADGWSATAVEIDPVVVDLAREYFGLSPEEGTIHEMDGREFLIHDDHTYDVVVLDAFGSSSIPFHLITRESFGLIASRLADDGIFVMNLETEGWSDVLVRSVSVSLTAHFVWVLALPAHEAPNGLGNVVIFASNRRLDEPSAAAEADGLETYRTFAWQNRFIPERAGAPILTDDLNPVDLWSERINLRARRDLHEYFRDLGVSW
ncbi:MAG: fused MFS/spermidine synthase [Acidobacteria bacterium]|nr:fused MFS/spermidine synthase [Acidobacteriota bacterium]